MDIFLNFAILTVFFLGGLNVSRTEIEFLGLFLSAVLVVFSYFKKRRIELPPGILLYEIFLVILIIYQLSGKISVYSIDYFLLFLSGGLFWISFYNLKDFGKNFEYLIYILGVMFTVLNFINLFQRPHDYYYWTLVYQATPSHNHIGDYWVFLILMVLFYSLIKFKKVYILFFFLGFLVLLFSNSRSAILAVFIGGFYLLQKILSKKVVKVANKYIYILIGLLAALFIYAGSFKATITSRIYFLQSFYSIYVNPMGIGIGNFGVISRSLNKLVPNADSYSLFTHNLVLEFAVGFGVLSVFFITWLIAAVFRLLKDKKADILFSSLFLALTVNFLFDATYFIPTMIWIWFVTLALATPQPGNKKT